MILVLNGPNLNRLGLREPAVYGTQTLEDLERLCEGWGSEHGVSVSCRQSNYEGQLIEWLQDAEEHGFLGVVLNAGGLTHSSYSLRDAIASQPLPVLEVHLSHLERREEFRHLSVLAPVCCGRITGLGFAGYRLAIDYLAGDYLQGGLTLRERALLRQPEEL